MNRIGIVKPICFEGGIPEGFPCKKRISLLPPNFAVDNATENQSCV